MDMRELICWLNRQRAEYCRMSDRIWELAELQYREEQSAQIQMEYLARRGFRIMKNLAGIPTAFTAEWGAGKPIIAILGEYDALDGMSQEAGADHYCPVAGLTSGHGCGHNLLGTAGVAAVDGVKAFLESSGTGGTIRYYGCPAEEGGAGKTFMVRAGCFQDVDAAITWHPSFQNMMFTTGTLANIQANFSFQGVSAHAAASPHMGRSALDALELMNVGVNFLREHVIQEARIHYAITNTGGYAPNVVQAEAEAVYLVRAPETAVTKEIFDRVVRIAQGAAMMTDTQMTMRFHTAVSNYIPNMTLTAQVEENFRTLLPILGIPEENESYMKKLLQGMPDCQLPVGEEAFIAAHGYCGGLLPQDGSSARASTDVGDVSWVVPTAQFEAACYAFGTPGHSWQRTAQGKSEMAYAGMMTAAKTMAMTACGLMSLPERLEAVVAEHRKNTADKPYICPIPEDIQPQI